MERIRLMLAHRAIAILAAAFVLGLAATLTGPVWLWALVSGGVGLQMLNEYAMHRFLFHLPPPREQWKFDLLYRAHYGHHDLPTCPSLFFVPAFVALPMLALHVLAAALVGELLLPGMGWRVAAAVTLTGGVGAGLGFPGGGLGLGSAAVKGGDLAPQRLHLRVQGAGTLAAVGKPGLGSLQSGAALLGAGLQGAAQGGEFGHPRLQGAGLLLGTGAVGLSGVAGLLGGPQRGLRLF